MMMMRPLVSLILLCSLALGVCSSAIPSVSSSIDASSLDARSSSDGGDDVVASADVIILGAGISGISAALQLIKEHNVTDILLIEARDLVGGRAYNHNLTNSKTGVSTVIEKGCNWIQGPGHHNITQLAHKWGLESVHQDYDSISYFKGAWGVDADNTLGTPRGHFLTDEESDFTDVYDDLSDAIDDYATYRDDNSLVDLSTRAAFGILGYLPKTTLQKAYEWFNVDFTAAQPPAISSFINLFAGDEEEELDRLVVDQRGYRYIFVKELEEVFGQGLTDSRLHLSTVVSTINYTDPSSIKVHTDKGLFVARKHVISSFSVGVMQEEDVTFTPALPAWKKEALYAFDMAVYQKAFLLFPSKFWKDDQFLLYADPDIRGRHTLWQNLNAPGFFNGTEETGYIYFVTNVYSSAEMLEHMTDGQVQDQLMLKLKEIYGYDIPDPVDHYFPRWRSDPLFRGSYSNWPIGDLDQHHANLRQPIGDNLQVFFTGEAMSEESFGYVQGAWEEGKATASQVAECVKGGGCASVEVFEQLKTCNEAETTLGRRTGTKEKRSSRPGQRRSRVHHSRQIRKRSSSAPSASKDEL